MAGAATLTSLASREADGTASVLLKVQPPAASERLPGDVCVVVDVSGSMQVEATIKDRSREAEAPPLSVLDIVKHAVKTMIHAMKPGDRLGIVAYSNDAKIVLPLTDMSEENVGVADAATESMNADGQTNLWDGLRTGLEMLSSNKRENASSALMLLTDGVPNVEPTGGHLPALAKYREERGGKLPGTVHTFGFGTDLDSKLLNQIAEAGDGMYVFIPDASFVGTCLVNCTSNSLVTMAQNAKISVNACAGCELKGCSGYAVSADGYISLGSLQYGQSKDVVVKVTAPADYEGPFLQAKLSYDGPGGAQEVPDGSSQKVTADATQLAEITAQDLRLGFAELAREILLTITSSGENCEAAKPLIDAFSGKLALPDPRIIALKEDVEGQVREATSRADWYKNWGMHYLQSLARAHLTQQCNNFKDPGVQLYGGDLFNDERDNADEMFLKLPPPAVSDRANIDMLTAMGFPEDQARQALAAAHDNVEIATTYLFEGIPARPPPPPARAAPRVAAASYSMADYYDRSGG